MLITNPLTLSIGCFTIGFLLGIVLYRGDYCMVAMLRDFFLLGDTTLLRSFFLFLLVAALLSILGRATGLIAVFPPYTLSPASMATVAGGLVFGVGMVLAGGCVVSTLYKMAGGNLTNWIAFSGIIAGSLLYAEVHPWLRDLAASTRLSDTRLLTEGYPDFATLLLGILLPAGAVLVWRWTRQKKFHVTAYAKGYLTPWRVAISFAALNFLFYGISGAPMSVTTAYAKLAAYLGRLVAPAHITGLSYFKENSVVREVGNSLLAGGAGPKLDLISYTELTLVGGIFAGAFATALWFREFKIYGMPPKRQAIAALVGGVLLAMGARTASGCNVKFFFGALPLLAYQGFFFAVAATAGVWIGTQILIRFVIR